MKDYAADRGAATINQDKKLNKSQEENGFKGLGNRIPFSGGSGDGYSSLEPAPKPYWVRWHSADKYFNGLQVASWPWAHLEWLMAVDGIDRRRG